MTYSCLNVATCPTVSKPGAVSFGARFEIVAHAEDDGREKRDGERRLVRVTEGRVVAASDIVEAVPEIDVVSRESEGQGEAGRRVGSACIDFSSPGVRPGNRAVSKKVQRLFISILLFPA